jgi:TM2 domain-containing membrane protein YozV
MKNKTTATFLSLLLGGLGIHKFYLGNNHFGIVYLLFCWTFIPSFIGVIEFFILVTMSDENFNKKYNKTVFESYMENTKTHNEPEINQLTSTKVIPQPLSSTHQQEHTSINEPLS